MDTAFLWYRRLLSLCYAFGASVHAGNLLGFGKYKLADMPRLLLIADIAYLVLDVVVVIGLWKGTTWGMICLFAAAGSQVLIYTVWPEAFTETDEERAQIRGMVWFHVVTVTIFVVLWMLNR